MTTTPRVIRLCRDGRRINVAAIGKHDNRPSRRPAGEACAAHLGATLERWWNQRRPDATDADVAEALRELAGQVERGEWGA